MPSLTSWQTAAGTIARSLAFTATGCCARRQSLEENHGKEDRWTFGSGGDARGLQRRSGRTDAKSDTNGCPAGQLLRRAARTDPERGFAAKGGRRIKARSVGGRKCSARAVLSSSPSPPSPSSRLLSRRIRL